MIGSTRRNLRNKDLEIAAYIDNGVRQMGSLDRAKDFEFLYGE